MRYADTNLAEAMAEGKDYVVKLKKTNPSSWRTHSSPLRGARAGPRLTTKGHGRLEQRAVWVSSDLAGYSTFPGLSNVIKVSKRVKHLKRGEWVE